jgi:hypothetical protein
LVFQAGSPDLERKLPNGAAAILQSPSSSGEKVTDSGRSNVKHGERGKVLLLETINSSVYQYCLYQIYIIHVHKNLFNHTSAESMIRLASVI